MKKRLLIVDDDAGVRELIKKQLGVGGRYSIETASGGIEAEE